MAHFLDNQIRIFILSAFLISVGLLQSQAQYSVDNYGFSQQVASYSPITGGTVLGNIDIDEEIFNGNTAGSTGIVSGNGFPIGFSFSLGGKSFTRFAVATNGYIRIGNGTFPLGNSTISAFSANFFNLADTLNFLNLLAPFHGDHEGQTGSELSFRTVGTAPNRELVVQWKNFIFWNTTGTENLNFQVRLQETTNKVIFSYGNFVKNPTDKLAAVGIRTDAYSIVHLRRARIDSSETWATSSKSLSRNTLCDIRTAYKPNNGLQYEFTGPSIPANDLALAEVSISEIINFGCPGSNAEPIKVLVRNNGTDAQSNLSYTLQVNGNAAGASTIPLNPPLASYEERQVTLTQTLDLSSAGTYSLKVWSALALDTGIYQTNDTARAAYSLFAPVQTPFASIRSLVEFQQKGWKTYNGKNKPANPGGAFTNSTIFHSASTSVFVSAFAADSIQEWLVSPSITPSPGLRLKFRAAITSFDSTTAATSIDDDEIKVLISTDCGLTWTNLFVFNGSSFTSGQILNTRKGYSIPIEGINSPFQIAFFVNNKGTEPTDSYYFHLDDVTMSLGNAYDLAALRLSVQNQGNVSCSQTTFPVKVWFKNVGDSVLTSSAASVKVNALAPVQQTFTFSPVLAKGDSVEVSFNSVTIPPNNVIRLVASSRLQSEDGFSSGNDTVSTSFIYLGSASPLSLPALITFDNLPSGVPAGWLVDQVQGTDFKVRVRGTGSTRSLSTNLYSNNKSSFAIMPVTQVLPASQFLSFDLRIKNDNTSTPFAFGPQDSVQVSVSSDCGNSFQTLFKSKASNPVGLETFFQVNIDLSSFQNQSVSVRFDAFINRTDFTGAWVDIDNVNVFTVTGITSFAMANQVGVYPNPVHDQIYFNFPSGTSRMGIKILSSDGRLISQSEAIEGRSLDVSALKPGIYFFEIEANHTRIRRKVMIH